MSRNRSVLNREVILKTALNIIDESGMDALSMRTVAKRLNVEAMSLYNHIENKEDLLNGIVEMILGEVEYPECSSDWKAYLKSTACSFHDVLLRHPNALPIISTHSPVTVKGLAQVEKILLVLKEAGITGISAFSLMHIVIAYIIGHAGMSITGTKDNKVPEQIDLSAFPNILEVSQSLSQRDINEEFLYGLELLLNNLQRK